MLQVGLDHLFDLLPADGAGVSVCSQGFHAATADTQVPAGEHHDALLLVLADAAQLVLPLPLHLPHQLVLHTVFTPTSFPVRSFP